MRRAGRGPWRSSLTAGRGLLNAGCKRQLYFCVSIPGPRKEPAGQGWGTRDTFLRHPPRPPATEGESPGRGVSGTWLSQVPATWRLTTEDARACKATLIPREVSGAGILCCQPAPPGSPPVVPQGLNTNAPSLSCLHGPAGPPALPAPIPAPTESPVCAPGTRPASRSEAGLGKRDNNLENKSTNQKEQ